MGETDHEGKGSGCCGANQTRGPDEVRRRSWHIQEEGRWGAAADWWPARRCAGWRWMTEAAHWDCWMKESGSKLHNLMTRAPAHLRGLRPVAGSTGWYQGCLVWGLAEVVTGKYDQSTLVLIPSELQTEKTATAPLRLLYWGRERGLSQGGLLGRAHFKSNS